MAAAFDRMSDPPFAVEVKDEPNQDGQWVLEALFLSPPDFVSLRLLEAAFGGTSIRLESMDEDAWCSPQDSGLRPVHVGNFFVTGHGVAGKGRGEERHLHIDSSMAFGTGHHESTRGCLRAISELEPQHMFRNILDVGCGSGILAMAAKMTWPESTVTASDIDEVSVEVALRNLEANDLGGEIDCIVADGFAHPELRCRSPYDLVLMNILKPQLLEFAATAARSLNAGGTLLLSGITTKESCQVRQAYRNAGCRLAGRWTEGEWTTLAMTRQGSN